MKFDSIKIISLFRSGSMVWSRIACVCLCMSLFHPDEVQAQKGNGNGNGNAYGHLNGNGNNGGGNGNGNNGGGNGNNGGNVNPARPFGLDIIGPAQSAGSDAQSSTMTGAQFNSIIDLYTQRITNPAAQSELVQLDPSQIALQTDYDARVYFSGLSGSYNNTLGLNTSGFGVNEGNPLLIAPYTLAAVDDAEFNRTAGQSLTNGEFVEIGTLQAGSAFDLFLVSNGGNGGTDVFSSNALMNADGFQHLMAFALPDSPYLLLGFEDMYGGGDQNFLDMVFALEVGQENIRALVMAANPEPAEYALIATFLIVGWHAARKKRLNEQVNSQ